MQNANDGRSNNETRKKCSDIDATLTIPITLGVTLEQASIKHAISEYEHRSDSTHLPPRELGRAPDEVLYKHDRWCCLHRQGCGERAMASSVPLLSLTLQMLLRLRRIARVRCSVWYLGGKSRWCRRRIQSVARTRVYICSMIMLAGGISSIVPFQ